MMNLLYEARQRLINSNSRLSDLQICMEAENLSKDAEKYLRDEIKKAEKNIKFYTLLTEKLEIRQGA